MYKKISMLIILICSFFIVEKVNADTFYFDNWIPDIFIRKDTGESVQNQQARITKRRDGTYAYCVEHGILVYNDQIYNGSSAADYQKLNITKEMMDKVKAIAYYGYGYSNHTDDKWYAITQVLIWKTIYPTWDIYYTDTFKGNRIEKFVDEESELRNLVDRHFTLPSFNNENKVIKLSDELVLTDTNNILNEYEIVNNDLVDVKKDNNKLILKPKASGSTTIKLQRKSNRFGFPLLLWTNPNSQDLVTTGDFDCLEASINVDVYKTSLTINKTGEDIEINDNGYKYINVPLNDVEFNLYATDDIYDNGLLKYAKGSLVNTLKTNKDGKILIDNLYYGKYKLIEVKSNLNNELLDREINFEITKETCDIVLDIGNKLDRKTLEFTKVDSNTNEVLANSEIEIYTSDDKLIYKGVTDEIGKIIIDDLFVGKFYIKEVKAPSNYKLFSNVINFEITNKDDVVKVSLGNEVIEDVPNTFKNQSIMFPVIILLMVISGVYGLKKKSKY